MDLEDFMSKIIAVIKYISRNKIESHWDNLVVQLKFYSMKRRVEEYKDDIAKLKWSLCVEIKMFYEQYPDLFDEFVDSINHMYLEIEKSAC